MLHCITPGQEEEKEEEIQVEAAHRWRRQRTPHQHPRLSSYISTCKQQFTKPGSEESLYKDQGFSQDLSSLYFGQAENLLFGQATISMRSFHF